MNDIRQELAEAYGIPAALASRLIGETREELEEDARELSFTLPRGPERLVGGLDPDGEDEEGGFDPVAHMRAHRAASRARWA
ncbi:hypothetical protein ACFVWY_14720 [Streptomyces sp. NPDC058195]|uniref:hypothetical protein n=1 Tax=Streptomyces sp. NPDC058195 TaxID=3346375 RepID=UPI0036E06EEF